MPWEKLIDRFTSNTFQISEGLPTVGLAYTEAKFGKQKNNNGVQGSRSGESTRFPPMWPGIHSQSSAIRGLSLLLVLFSAPRGFSIGTPGFASPQNPAFPNSNSTCIQIFLSPAWENWGMLIFQDFSYSIARHYCFGVWNSRCFSVFHSTDSISQIKQFQWDFGIKKCPKNVLAKPNNSGPGSSLSPWHALRSPFRPADYWENIVVSGSSKSGR